MREGEIRGLLSICNNVMVSLPDTNEVRRSLEGLDFYVCIDFFMSEGSRYADVVLPGSAWSEDEGVTCNSEGRVVKINKANDPPGEARADWWIVQEIARRMGREKYFRFNSPREIFDELRVASRGGNADYYGITWEKIERTTASSGRAQRKIIRERRACLKIASIIRTAKRSFTRLNTTRRTKCPTKNSR